MTCCDPLVEATKAVSELAHRSRGEGFEIPHGVPGDSRDQTVSLNQFVEIGSLDRKTSIMLRRILLPLDPSPYCACATRHAIQLAEESSATVTGLVILDLPEITTSSAVGFDYRKGIYPQDLLQEKINEAKQQIEALVGAFEKQCEDAAVAHEIASVQGIPAMQITNSAVFHDVVAMGLRTYYHFETRETPSESLEEVLSHSVAPVLAVPETFKGKLQNILIAFDGSFHAASTLHKFVKFADPDMVRITVLTADMKREAAEICLRNTREYLRAHGFQSVETVWSEMKPYDVIREDFADDVDLIVAGIHSKKPIRDLFVGSFTRSLIAQGSIPLFLGQ